MSREEFLEEVLESCEFFHWNVLGVYKHYELVSVTQNFVRVSVVSWGEDTGYAKYVDFQNQESLIDNMINTL